MIDADYIRGWTAADAHGYVEQHHTRLVKTLEITPPGDASKAVLEMGAYMQITPALHFKLGYGRVRGCYYGTLGTVDHKAIESVNGEHFECDIDHFDAEKDIFPYDDQSFDTVICGELLEHLFEDPMHMMFEINRILKPGGHLVLTTPNIGSLRGLAAVLQGYHPGFFPAYTYPREKNEDAAPRHNREYMPMEIQHLFTDAGFSTELITTGEFAELPHPEYAWVQHLLERYQLPRDLRGDGIYAVGSKTGAPRKRWPEWLYQ